MNSTDQRPPRKPRGPVGRWFLRAPIGLYRIGLGRLLGRRFVMVEHTGRVSGLRRRVVLEVIARTEDALMVPSAWPNSDWYRNLRVEPLARISSGRLRSVPATARVLEQAEAESVFDRYAANHLRAAKALSSTLGLPLLDRTAMARSVPVVELSYRSEESERP